MTFNKSTVTVCMQLYPPFTTRPRVPNTTVTLVPQLSSLSPTHSVILARVWSAWINHFLAPLSLEPLRTQAVEAWLQASTSPPILAGWISTVIGAFFSAEISSESCCTNASYVCVVSSATGASIGTGLRETGVNDSSFTVLPLKVTGTYAGECFTVKMIDTGAVVLAEVGDAEIDSHSTASTGIPWITDTWWRDTIIGAMAVVTRPPSLPTVVTMSCTCLTYTALKAVTCGHFPTPSSHTSSISATRRCGTGVWDQVALTVRPSKASRTGTGETDISVRTISSILAGDITAADQLLKITTTGEEGGREEERRGGEGGRGGEGVKEREGINQT